MFLNNAIDGANAMRMGQIVWIDQEVVLLNPKLVGEWRSSLVVELTEFLVPIRTVPEIRDKLALSPKAFSDAELNAIFETKFTKESGILAKTIKTFR